MRVEILDTASLRSISPAALRGFALFEGWKPVEMFGDTSQIYSGPNESKPVEIILPVTTEIGDYASVVSRLIGLFSRALGRDELAIFRDLTHADRDVIRVRATEGEEDGSIAIGAGADLIYYARDMLASAACATTERRRAYYVGQMQQAGKYMERVKLGQTEIGSFVVALLAPVPPALDDSSGIQLLWPEMEDEPYERRVTRVLSNALFATKSALAAINRGQGKSAFEAAVSAGVSANLCEAIAAICERGDGSEVTVSWAKTRPTPEPARKVWFSPDESVVLREVAREFRLKEPRRDITLSGYTPDLKREQVETTGTVKLIGLIDGRPTSVSVELAQEDYERAVDAHVRQLGISVTGDLTREGQRWKMIRAHNVSIVAGANEEGSPPTSASSAS